MENVPQTAFAVFAAFRDSVHEESGLVLVLPLLVHAQVHGRWPGTKWHFLSLHLEFSFLPFHQVSFIQAQA